MKTIYLVTMWSGGKPAKKWTSDTPPELLEHGTGVAFTSRETKLPVKIIGPISVEEYESGKEEMEARFRIDFAEDKPSRPNLAGE